MKSRREEAVVIQSKLLGFTTWFKACWNPAMLCPRILESLHHTVGKFGYYLTFLTAIKSENKEADSQD